ncbi:unnamed protein product [Brassicogethes aeneus]|uniref:SWI/SNF-related matrix-associated actin-dependent regulator of chromatin subfamily A-like protein 1 n=1 Tax=Brassicogethes aeneus TaxID=1431903 RepID=A0A9P0FNJ9_BRAAE|nr:unnamed protein product [Brassicogethes aeneus]
MQCTKEEIEEKKRIAKERLARKMQCSPVKASLQSFANSTSPRFKFNRDNSNQKAPTTSFFNRNAKPYDKPGVSAINQTKFYGKDKIFNVKMCLMSEQRFVVEMEFFQPVIEIFKTIPTRNYNSSTRKWDFHIKDYEMLISKLQVLRANLNIDTLPSFVLNCLKRKSTSTIGDMSKIDSELLTSLMPFQIEGVNFGIDKNGRCLIADDMGLGKTFQALALANYYKTDWPLLIVTTASMTSVWEETIHRYLPSVSILSTQYMVTGKDYIGEAKILIVSHDMMSRALDRLLDRNFGVIIIDESHVLKNFKAKCSKSAAQLAKKAKRVVLLSGTPALSRPCELFTQLALLDEKFFGNFFAYSKRYCDGKTTNFGWDASGKSNLQELEIVLQKVFMIRRTKEDVLRSLPNKIQEVVMLDVNLKQFSEQDRRCLNYLAEKYNNMTSKRDKHALLLTFFSESAKIKIPSVCSYILQVLETKAKFLVFAHHQVMMNAIVDILRKKDVKYIRIDGNTTSDQRKNFVNKFQLDDSVVCAVLSITAANAGITLTAAQLVLFAELHWNPSILSQAESRAHRIGQENHVIVRYLLGKGTADDSMWYLLQQKQKILSEIGLSKDSFRDVAVTNQATSDEKLTENLNLTCAATPANTLDISSYFNRNITIASDDSFNDNEDNNDEFNDSAILDDGMDDLFCDINLDINL